MTHNWLTLLSTTEKTEEEDLIDSLITLPLDEMQKLAWEENPSSRPIRMNILQEKLATAEKQGRELAHENNQLQKIAFVPALLSTAGKSLAGGGAKNLLGGVAKDMAIGAVGNKVMGALKPAASAGGEMAGGFKYASMPTPGIGQQVAGFLHRNPGAGMAAGGAILGAAMAPRDAQTGQKQYMRGAVMGGVGAAGANAISGGRMADRMKQMVTRQNNPLLGQNARRFMTESAYATRPGATSVPSVGGQAAGMASSTVPTPARPAASWVAKANMGVQEMKNKNFDQFQTAPLPPARTGNMSGRAGYI